MRKELLVSINPALKILLAVQSLIMFAGAMLGPIYALYVEEIGGDILDASFASAAYALTAVIVVQISAHVSDRTKEDEFVVIVGYMIMALGYFSYIWVGSMTELLLAQVVIGLGEAIYSPAFDGIYTKHVDKNSEAKQWGMWESMYYVSAFVGALVGGLIATKFGFTPLFGLMGGLCLTAAYIIFKQPRKLL